MVAKGSTWVVSSGVLHAQEIRGHSIAKPIENGSSLAIIDPEGLASALADGDCKIAFIVLGDTKKQKYWCFEQEFLKRCSPTSARACSYCGAEVPLASLQGRASLKCPNPECGKIVYVTTDDRLIREPPEAGTQI